MRTLLGGLAAALLAAPLAVGAPKAPRVVVLGFDGVDAHVVEEMMASGRLPNLNALRRRGGYSPLTPTLPAQTPVSWSTFSTGLDPGGHEIFDFLKRDPANRVPTFAVAEEIEKPFLAGRWNAAAAGCAVLFVFAAAAALLFRRRAVWAGLMLAAGIALAAGAALAARAWLPQTRPAVKNNRLGKTFWSEPVGSPATVIRMPVTFPPESFEKGRLLSGLGVPDLSGRIGKPFYYTSDPFFTPREGNDFSIELVRLESNTGRLTTKIVGPPGKPFGREGSIEIPMTIEVSPSRDRLTIQVAE